MTALKHAAMAAVLSACLVAGCTGHAAPDASPGTPGGSPSAGTPSGAGAATTLTARTTIALPQVVADQEVIAATKASIVRRVIEAHGDRYEFSLDRGVSWQPVPSGLNSPGSLYGTGGFFVGATQTVRADDGDLIYDTTGLQVWRPESGLIRTLALDTGFSWSGPDVIRDAVGTVVSLVDGRVLDLSGTIPVARRLAFEPTKPDEWVTRQLLTADGGFAVRYTQVRPAGSDRDGTGWLAVAPLDGTPGPARVAVKNLAAFDVVGSTIHYLVAATTGLRLCQASVDAPSTASCRVLLRGDFRGPQDTRLELSGPGTGVALARRDRTSHVQVIAFDSRAVKALDPSASGRWELPAQRDPAALVVSRNAGSAVDQAFAVTGLRLSPLFSPPPTGSRVDPMVLSTGGITAADFRPFLGGSRDPNTVWSRTVDGSSVGAESLLALSGREVQAVLRSGSRTVVRGWSPAGEEQLIYDGGRLVDTRRGKDRLPGWQLSGPFLQGGSPGTVSRVDGVPQGPGDVIFGSLVGTWSAAAGTLTVRDLAGGSPAATVQLPAGTFEEYVFPALALWGDWAAFGRSYGAELTQDVYVANLRTGENHTYPGWLVGLGDGYVVVGALPGSDTTVRATVQVLATGVRAELPLAYRVSTDGLGEIAWLDGSGINLATIPGVARSAPRLLGYVAPASFAASGGGSYRPAIDATGRLLAGTLQITDSAGTIVRTLPTEAAPLGAVRGVSWDGRDSAGKLVAAGTYTWTLKADGADGSGTITSVDGQRPATGVVKVIR